MIRILATARSFDGSMSGFESKFATKKGRRLSRSTPSFHPPAGVSARGRILRPVKDIGRYLRLQGAIRAAIDAVPDGQAALAGHAMMNAYRRFRSEARTVIAPENFSEFDAMFPTGVIFERANPRDDLQDAAAEFNAARLQLSTTAGWLDGFVQEAKMQMEAEA